MWDEKEYNRLIQSGLTQSLAIWVLEGKLDEAVAITRATENNNADNWCSTANSIPANLNALWDYQRINFYLALDGADPDDNGPRAFGLIDAEVAEVDSMLTGQSSRDVDPWHGCYRTKSCGIAYRWSHSLKVTPPFIRPDDGQVHIKGGHHRFHLAKYYEEHRMPFLVKNAELECVLGLLPSAKAVPNLIIEP